MNRVFGFMEALKDPQAFLDNAMSNPQVRNNPIAQNVVKMYQNGDGKGLKELGTNLLKERGITQEQVMNIFK